MIDLATPEELRALQVELNGLLEVLRKNHVRKFKTGAMEIHLHRVVDEQPVQRAQPLVNAAFLKALDDMEIDPDHPAAKNVALQMQQHLNQALGSVVDDTDEDDDESNLFTDG